MANIQKNLAFLKKLNGGKIREEDLNSYYDMDKDWLKKLTIKDFKKVDEVKSYREAFVHKYNAEDEWAYYLGSRNSRLPDELAADYAKYQLNKYKIDIDLDTPKLVIFGKFLHNLTLISTKAYIVNDQYFIYGKRSESTGKIRIYTREK